MIDTPEVVESQEWRTAVIRIKVPRAEMMKVMGPAMREVKEAAAAQGVAAAGPLFSHHFRMDPEVFDFEVGVPVAEPVQSDGRLEAGTLPAMRVARTVYHGGYEGLGAAWGEFKKWIAEQKVQTRGDLWEVYVKGPESGNDPQEWQTELNWPLAG